MLQPHQLLLVYDGKCGFCSSVARILRRLDWRGRIYTLPFQIEGLPEEMGSSLREARRTALALTPSGKLWRGAGSAAASFDMLLPFGLPLFRLLYSLRSEEHTSELQSRENLVCRLLLEKKKNNTSV